MRHPQRRLAVPASARRQLGRPVGVSDDDVHVTWRHLLVFAGRLREAVHGEVDVPASVDLDLPRAAGRADARVAVRHTRQVARVRRDPSDPWRLTRVTWAVPHCTHRNVLVRWVNTYLQMLING